MIVSIGIDIVEVYRIRETLARTPRFMARVFTTGERAYCDAKGEAAPQSYAARFAAKEACLKALGTGWRGKITWRDIEVVSNPLGAPCLEVHNDARRMLVHMGVDRVHVSLSHTIEHAIAQVVFERAVMVEGREPPITLQSLD